MEAFLLQIRDELVAFRYLPLAVRKREIPKDGGKVRVLSIPAIRDRVVQGALKLILEPVFEPDFQPEWYGYRPRRTAQQAAMRVDEAIMKRKKQIVDLDLKAYSGEVALGEILALRSLLLNLNFRAAKGEPVAEAEISGLTELADETRMHRCQQAPGRDPSPLKRDARSA